MKRADGDPAFESSSDSELIQIMARKGDRAAFGELFQRYEKIGYQVALNVTCDHHLAEDTFLEAMHRVWHSAHTFKPIGSARGWIIRIIVRTSMKGQNAKTKRRQREPKSLDQVSEPHKPSKQILESDELLAGLKKSLKDISSLDRNILTLRFVGGLSQVEIGKELSMSQRTVSERITQTLAVLRRHLTRAGLTAAIPLLTDDGIASALCDGTAIPSGLKEKVLSRIDEDAKSIERMPVYASKGKLLLTTFAIVCFVGVVGAAAWQQGFVGPLSGKTVHLNTKDTDSSDSPHVPTFGHWDFNVPLLDNLETSEGIWKHLPKGGPDGSGCMAITGDSRMRIGMEVSTSKLPLEVRFNLKMSSGNFSLYMMGWGNQIPVAIIQPTSFQKVFYGNWRPIRCFITRKHISVWSGETLLSLAMYEKLDSKRLRLHLMPDWSIDDLEIRKTTSSTDLGATRYVAAVEAIPLEDRQFFNLLPRLTETQARYKDGLIFRVLFSNFRKNDKVKPQAWNFRNQNQLLDFAVTTGSWRFLPGEGKDKTGCVEIKKGNFFVGIDSNVRKLPLLITTRWRSRNMNSPLSAVNIKWMNLGVPNASALYLPENVKLTPDYKWIRTRTYVTDRYIDTWMGNQRVELNVRTSVSYGMPYIISKSCTQIDFLEIQSINPKELPKLGRLRAMLNKP